MHELIDFGFGGGDSKISEFQTNLVYLFRLTRKPLKNLLNICYVAFFLIWDKNIAADHRYHY